MGLLSWLFGKPEPKPRRKPTQAQHAQERRERQERADRERSERERRVFEQMDRSYAAGRLVNPRLTAAERSALPDSAFAVPTDHKLPLEDAGHVRNAVARFGQTEFRNVAEARAAARLILEAAVKHDIPVGPNTIVAEVAGYYGQRVNPGLFDVKPEFGGTRYKPTRKTKPVSSGGVGDFWRPQYEGHKPGETPTSEAERMRQDRSSKDMFEGWSNPTGAGYLDGGGQFHPIRSWGDYSPVLSGEDQLLSGYWEHPDKRIRTLADRIGAEELRIAGRTTPGAKRTIKTRIKAQRRRLVDLLKRYDRREREETDRYEAERKRAEQEWSGQSSREWKRELRQAIKAVSPSGIAPHEKTRSGSALGTEYRLDIPINLRNRRGLPPDEVAQLLAYEYPHLGIESEDDLLKALGR